MKKITEFIIEKLKVSKNSVITLESLLKVLKDYNNRNNRNNFKNNYISLWGIFKEYPTVLQYNGTYTDKNIIGNEIHAIRYIYDQVSKTDTVFIYFDQNMVTESIQIENTKELYDIFGEEALYKIYDYIINHV